MQSRSGELWEMMSKLDIRVALNAYISNHRNKTTDIRTLTLFLNSNDGKVVINAKPRKIRTLHITDGVISQSLAKHLMECNPAIVDFSGCKCQAGGYKYLRSMISKSQNVGARNVSNSGMISNVVKAIESRNFKGSFKVSHAKFIRKVSLSLPVFQNRISRLELFSVTLSQSQYIIFLRALETTQHLRYLSLLQSDIGSCYPYVKGTRSFDCKLQIGYPSALLKEVIGIDTSRFQNFYLEISLRLSVASLKRIITFRARRSSQKGSVYTRTAGDFSYYVYNEYLNIFCGERHGRSKPKYLDGALLF